MLLTPGRNEPTMTLRNGLTRVILSLLLLCSMTGCGFTYRFRNTSTVAGIQHEELASYYLFGIVGDNTIDVREFCGQSEVHEVTTGTNFMTWLVTTFTIGIYNPRKVNITCSGGPRNTSYEIDFGGHGDPMRVTKRAEGLALSGEVSDLVAGRYGVLFRPAPGSSEGGDR
jgi:hypothetical protein